MVAYFTDISSGFAVRLADEFEKSGVAVTGGVPNGPVDLFVSTENERAKNDFFSVSSGIDPDAIMDAVRRHVSEPLKKLEEVLPYLERGGLKRICFLSGASASVNMNAETSGYGYNMSKAALHNALMIIKNRLGKEGYTFRLYDPMANSLPHTAADYFLKGLGKQHGNEIYGQNEERRLTLRDALGREWPW
ncbi:MAG: hypothetical protein FWE82_00915 [Defluviitaleaceae bacterium]|nr:hypothetical protein [Defluviitaleaceae bacterium]